MLCSAEAGSRTVPQCLRLDLQLHSERHRQFAQPINQVVQQMQKLYQTTVAPLAALNQARGFVANSINSFRGQMNQIFNTPFTSAVTPGPQQFESILHSRLSAQIPGLAGQLHDELWGDPAGQCSFAAGPRHDGCRRRSGPGEPQDNPHRRPGAATQFSRPPNRWRTR